MQKDENLILIEPQNPLDLRPEDLQDLISAIQEIAPSYDVRLAYLDNEAVGVTFHEVLHIWLLSAPFTAPLLTEITKLGTGWLRERFKKYPNRPKSLVIYGPNNKPLKGVVLKHINEEPEDDSGLDKRATRNRPPVR